MMLPKEKTSIFSLYRGGVRRASGGRNANVPFTDDFRVSVVGLIARLVPKSLTLVTKVTRFNSTLLELKS